jgi:hypothetical protein
MRTVSSPYLHSVDSYSITQGHHVYRWRFVKSIDSAKVDSFGLSPFFSDIDMVFSSYNWCENIGFVAFSWPWHLTESYPVCALILTLRIAPQPMFRSFCCYNPFCSFPWNLILYNAPCAFIRHTILNTASLPTHREWKN